MRVRDRRSQGRGDQGGARRRQNLACGGRGPPIKYVNRHRCRGNTTNRGMNLLAAETDEAAKFVDRLWMIVHA